MQDLTLNIVSFQSPFPPDYGGVIDVYYKLCALHKLGMKIILHTFIYKNRQPSSELEAITEKVYYYQRINSFESVAGSSPYIVASRLNPELLTRLAALPAASPILFEGLHTCGYLNHPLLADKFKIVRTHNVEHDYYRLLANGKAPLWKKAYYIAEAFRLKNFEKNIEAADAIAAISENDLNYFRQNYPGVPSELIPCFFDDSSISSITEDFEKSDFIPNKPYVLYHANLSVAENADAALYILKNVWPLTNHNIPLIIAGKDPSAELHREVKNLQRQNFNVTLIDTPSRRVMTELIIRAAVNLLFTFQPTGIKLKLINTLAASKGHCVVNAPMVNATGVENLCVIADSPQEQAQAVLDLIHNPLSFQALADRKASLLTIFDNIENARKLITLTSAL